MRIEPKHDRCIDALAIGCPDRRSCLRWVDRNLNIDRGTRYMLFAKDRGPTGCDKIIKIREIYSAD